MKTPYAFQQVQLDQQYVVAAVQEWRAQHRESYYQIDTRRQRMSPALAHTETYALRMPKIAVQQIQATESTANILECVNTRLAPEFPAIWMLIDEIGKQVHGDSGWTQLGRVFVTRLAAGAEILPHIDQGQYFEQLERVHVVLDSDGSTEFCWDNSSTHMPQNTVWLYNNSVRHWVRGGQQPRTHLIFDAC